MLMRFFALAMMLTCSPAAFAAWQFLGATADGTAYLIDPASIKSKGQLVEMLTMQNLRTARKVNGSEFRSAIGHTLYNCADKTSATTVIHQFSEERGAGKVVGSFKQKPKEIIWDAILPNTIMEKEWKVACGVS